MVDPKLTAVQAALERAHNSSKFGSSAAQSGSIDDRSTYVRALLSKAQAAARSWANWEAINENFYPASDAAKAADWLALTAIAPIRKALARDAILTAFGLSDPIQKNRITFCQLASWLDEATVKKFSSREWVLDQGCSLLFADAESEANVRRMVHLKQLVVPDWKTEEPGNVKLRALREQLWPTRKHLAHALDAGISELATIDQIRQFVSLTLELATDAALIWTGSAIGAQQMQDFARKEADRFWNVAFAEPIRIWRADIDSRKGGIVHQ